MNHFAIAGLQLAVSDQDNRYLIRSMSGKGQARLSGLTDSTGGTGQLRPGHTPVPSRCRAADRDLLLRTRPRTGYLWLVPGHCMRRPAAIFNTAGDKPQGRGCRPLSQTSFLSALRKGISAGAEFGVLTYRVGRFGLSICYDQWFPETTRQLADGAEVILCPTMTNTLDRDLELSIARANAAVNQCYFFNINVAGALGNGRSIVVGPGTVIHQAGADNEIMPVEIDMSLLRRVRSAAHWDWGRHSRAFATARWNSRLRSRAQRRSDARTGWGSCHAGHRVTGLKLD